MKDRIIELRIIPQNESHDLNYQEIFKGTFDQIQSRAAQISYVLQRLLPNGTFTVKLEDIKCTKEWYYINGLWYDENFNLIKPSQQSLLN